MHFDTTPGPYIAPQRQVADLMTDVLKALAPGILAMTWLFGVGVLVQCALAVGSAVLGEAAMLRLRGREIRPALSDGSALVTGLLLGVSLPPLTPWGINVTGSLFAMVFGKHLYGGLGNNPFNPAMVGYAVLLISYPKAMTFWPAPTDLLPVAFNTAASLSAIFDGLADGWIDALAMPTPLTVAHQRLVYGTVPLTAGTIPTGVSAWTWINLAFLAGGLRLAKRGTLDRRIPMSLLAALSLCALILKHTSLPDAPGVAFHLFSGSTMLAAFFIATDPVTAATTPLGRWIYGAGIGMLILVIRTWGGYPDGVAFAVLLMNFAAPTIDQYTRPRIYGH
jgi:electron transport complex protein RnfD